MAELRGRSNLTSKAPKTDGVDITIWITSFSIHLVFELLHKGDSVGFLHEANIRKFRIQMFFLICRQPEKLFAAFNSSFLQPSTLSWGKDNVTPLHWEVDRLNTQGCHHSPSKKLHFTTFLFPRDRSYASAVLGVVILSVRPSVCLSVCHTRALWLIQRTYRRYFHATWKGNLSSFLMPKISAKFQRGHPRRGRQIEVG